MVRPTRFELMTFCSGGSKNKLKKDTFVSLLYPYLVFCSNITIDYAKLYYSVISHEKPVSYFQFPCGKVLISEQFHAND